MTSTELLRRYWRVPVVGLLAAVLAFAAALLHRLGSTRRIRGASA